MADRQVGTAFLDGGGDMSAAVRDFDWSTTALGPITSWPVSLKTAVGMMLNSRFPKAIVWGPELTTLYNDAFRPILGHKPEALGRSFREVWAEAWDEIAPILEKAFAGEATFIEDFPLTIERHGAPERAHFTFCYSPIRDQTGRVVGMIDTVIETTSKVEAERHVRLINAELEHRIKNTLTVVGAVARQTFHFSNTLDEARDALATRLSALSAAHSALTKASWTRAPIGDVLEGALSPYQVPGEQITLAGPALHLGARQALSLSLAINELASNALKYGALSTPAGHIAVRWQGEGRAAEMPFRLAWEETGGPATKPPTRKGFGSQLLRVLAMDFQGEAELTFPPEGACFALRGSIARFEE